MHIDKFLCDIEKPSFLPGPFSVRLKYELKQSIFERKFSKSTHLVYSVAIMSLFVICSLMVLKPQTAQRMHSLVFRGNDQTLDMLLLAEKDIDVSNFPSSLRTVSTEANSALPFIEEDKSYLIYKFRNHENKTLFYISEIKNSGRVLY